MNHWVVSCKENNRHDAKEEQDPTGCKQVDPPTSEIESGLERKQGQSQAERGRDTNSHQDPRDVMVDGDTGHPHGTSQGKDTHGDDVSGGLPANGFTTSDGKISDEKNDIGHDIDDKAILTGSHTMD